MKGSVRLNRHAQAEPPSRSWNSSACFFGARATTEALVGQLRPHVVLMDLRMPRRDGVAAILAKTGLRDRTQAALFAVQSGLVEESLRASQSDDRT